MKHNYGIDLLKIISMFMVVVGHILLSGGINEVVSHPPYKGSLIYYTVFGLRLITICAVDAFVLVTGFVYQGRSVKLSRVIGLWCQVVLLSVLVLIIALALGYHPTTTQYWMTFCPLSTYHYWFVTQYFLLLLLIPALNKFIDAVELRSALGTIGALMLIFSIIPTFISSTVVPTNGGYTVVWFVVLYLIGATVRRWNLSAYVGPMKAFSLFVIAYLGSILLGWGGGMLAYQYNSPFVFMEALALLIWCAQIKFTRTASRRIVTILSSASFAVYVIHSNTIFRSVIGWDGRWIFCTSYNPFYMVGVVLLSGLFLYVGCGAIDIVRKFAFQQVGAFLSRSSCRKEC